VDVDRHDRTEGNPLAIYDSGFVVLLSEMLYRVFVDGVNARQTHKPEVGYVAVWTNSHPSFQDARRFASLLRSVSQYLFIGTWQWICV